MVQPDEVDAEAAQAAGDARGVLGLGEVGAKGQIDAEEAHALIVGGIGLEVFSDPVEVAAADEDAVGGGERVVEEAEVGGA